MTFQSIPLLYNSIKEVNSEGKEHTKYDTTPKNNVEFLKSVAINAAVTTLESVALGYIWSKIVPHSNRLLMPCSPIQWCVISGLASLAISVTAAALIKNGLNKNKTHVFEASAKIILNGSMMTYMVKIGVINVLAGTIFETLSFLLTLKELNKVTSNTLNVANALD